MPSPPGDLTTLLSKLASSGVEFVLVGGLAAVAQGAPITTHDVDIVPKRTPENIDALLTVLASMDAKYRGRGEQVLRPTAGALLGPGHSLLMTDLGPLDVLGAIEEGRAFADLLSHSIGINLGGHPVRILDLPTLVELKRNSTHPKDRYTLLILEETLRTSGG